MFNSTTCGSLISSVSSVLKSHGGRRRPSGMIMIGRTVSSCSIGREDDVKVWATAQPILAISRVRHCRLANYLLLQLMIMTVEQAAVKDGLFGDELFAPSHEWRRSYSMRWISSLYNKCGVPHRLRLQPAHEASWIEYLPGSVLKGKNTGAVGRLVKHAIHVS